MERRRQTGWGLWTQEWHKKELFEFFGLGYVRYRAEEASNLDTPKTPVQIGSRKSDYQGTKKGAT